MPKQRSQEPLQGSSASPCSSNSPLSTPPASPNPTSPAIVRLWVAKSATSGFVGADVVGVKSEEEEEGRKEESKGGLRKVEGDGDEEEHELKQEDDGQKKSGPEPGANDLGEFEVKQKARCEMLKVQIDKLSHFIHYDRVNDPMIDYLGRLKVICEDVLHAANMKDRVCVLCDLVPYPAFFGREKEWPHKDACGDLRFSMKELERLVYDTPAKRHLSESGPLMLGFAMQFLSSVDQIKRTEQRNKEEKKHIEDSEDSEDIEDSDGGEDVESGEGSEGKYEDGTIVNEHEKMEYIAPTTISGVKMKDQEHTTTFQAKESGPVDSGFHESNGSSEKDSGKGVAGTFKLVISFAKPEQTQESVEWPTMLGKSLKGFRATMDSDNAENGTIIMAIKVKTEKIKEHNAEIMRLADERTALHQQLKDSNDQLDLMPQKNDPRLGRQTHKAHEIPETQLASTEILNNMTEIRTSVHMASASISEACTSIDCAISTWNKVSANLDLMDARIKEVMLGMSREVEHGQPAGAIRGKQVQFAGIGSSASEEGDAVEVPEEQVAWGSCRVM